MADMDKCGALEISASERRRDGQPKLNPKYHILPYEPRMGGKPMGSPDWATRMGARSRDDAATKMGKDK